MNHVLKPLSRRDYFSSLLNLVLNARDAMAEGGVIRFSAMRTRALGQDTVTLKIGDDGIGIPKDKLATVF